MPLRTHPYINLSTACWPRRPWINNVRRWKNLHGATLTGQPVFPPPPPGQGSPTPLMKWVASPSESKMRCGRSRARNVVTVPSSLRTPTHAQIHPSIPCRRVCAPLLGRGVGDDGRDIPVPAVRGEGVAAHGCAEGLVVHAVADGVVAWLAAVGVHPAQQQPGYVRLCRAGERAGSGGWWSLRLTTCGSCRACRSTGSGPPS